MNADKYDDLDWQAVLHLLGTVDAAAQAWAEMAYIQTYDAMPPDAVFIDAYEWDGDGYTFWWYFEDWQQ